MATRNLDITFGRGTQPWNPQAYTSDVGSGVFTFNAAYAASGSAEWFSWGGPLPDLVLAPLSTIVLIAGHNGGSNPAIAVGGIAVTLTSEALASTVETPQVTPLFVPLPVEDIQPAP